MTRCFHWILLGACLMTACGGSKSTSGSTLSSAVSSSDLATDEKLGVSGVVAQFTEPSYFEQGVGIHATGQGSSLVVSLRNKTGKTIQFIPRDFAVITSAKREDLIILTPSEAQIYTADVEIPDGESAFMRADLRRAVDVAGKRLVYNNPRDGIRFFVEIE
jgi:hypothetical protein